MSWDEEETGRAPLRNKSVKMVKVARKPAPERKTKAIWISDEYAMRFDQLAARLKYQGIKGPRLWEIAIELLEAEYPDK